jgi:hypothetical protein
MEETPTLNPRTSTPNTTNQRSLATEEDHDQQPELDPAKQPEPDPAPVAESSDPCDIGEKCNIRERSQNTSPVVNNSDPCQIMERSNYSHCSFSSKDKEHSAGSKRYPKLPVFDDTKLDFESYLANLKAVTPGWTSEERLALLREKLEGRAAKVLANLDLAGGCVTFDQLTTAVEHHYVGERSEWMARLRDVRREPGRARRMS